MKDNELGKYVMNRAIGWKKVYKSMSVWAISSTTQNVIGPIRISH